MFKLFRKINEETVLRLLISIASIFIIFSAFFHSIDNEGNWWGWWNGAFQNLSTEIVGAALTFSLFELVLGVKNRKDLLLIQIRSSDNKTVLNALDLIKKENWHKSGLFRAIDMFQVEFSNANLNEADFESARLHKAIFNNAELVNTNFEKAALFMADFSNSKMAQTNFQDADLSLAKFNNAFLINVNFQNASLRDVVFKDTVIGIKVILPDAVKIGQDEQENPIYDKYWSPETDIRQYTDETHPKFWEPEWMTKKNNEVTPKEREKFFISTAKSFSVSNQ